MLAFIGWALLAFTGSASAADAEKIRELVEAGKADRAVKACQAFERSGTWEGDAREWCATAAYAVLAASGPSNVATLDAFTVAWSGTKAGMAAHVAASEQALDAAQDERALEAVLSVYGDTPAAAVATTRLRELQWTAVLANPTPDGIRALAERWRDQGGVLAVCARVAKAGRLEGGARAWCAEQALGGLPGASAEAILEDFARTWEGTPAALDALDRLRQLQWTKVSAAPTVAALGAFIARWPDSAQAGEARGLLDSARLTEALTLALSAGALPDPMDARAREAAGYACPSTGDCTGRVSPALRIESAGFQLGAAPPAVLLAWLRGAGPPSSGSFADASNWSAAWSTSNRTVVVAVTDLYVRMESAAAAPSAPPAPEALLSQLASLVAGGDWKATLPPGAPTTWERFATVGGRAVHTARLGGATWLRLDDPALHATRTWSFKHTVPRGATLPPEPMFTTTSDGLGILALEGCTVVPLPCDGDEMRQLTGCKAAVVTAAGGPISRASGLGASVGIGVRGVGDGYSRGAVNGYCYDIVESASWKDLRLSPTGWQAVASAGAPEAGATSLEGAASIPAALAYTPGEDQWCGDVTVYTPGLLTLRATNTMLSRKAIGASVHGPFVRVEEAVECEVREILVDTRSGRRVVAGGEMPVEPILAFIGDAPSARLEDLVAGGRFASCTVEADGALLACGKDVTAVHDRSLAPVPDALSGIPAPVARVSAPGVLGLQGRGAARWLLASPTAIQVGPAQAGVTALSAEGTDGGTLLVSRGATTVLEVWDGKARSALGTYGVPVRPVVARSGAAPFADGTAVLDAEQGLVFLPASVWGRRSPPGPLPDGAVVLDLRAGAAPSLLQVPPGTSGAIDALRVGREVQLLGADGVTWKVVRLP